MRKALILLLAVLILFSSCFLIAHGLINDANDQVTWEEVTRYGDKTKAYGLTVNAQNRHQSSLLWDTVGIIGETLEPETEFTFSNENLEYDTEIIFTGVRIDANLHIYEMLNYEGIGDYGRKKYADLIAFYREAEASTPEGEERSFTVNLSDYMDYYPLAGCFDLPGYDSGFWDEFFDYDGWARLFNEYFKIPIVGDYEVEFSIDKYYDNTTMASGIMTEYEPDFDGLVTEDACYFTFNPVTVGGRIADTSLIPGGYGIYKLGLTVNDLGEISPDPDSLSTVFSLDPAERYNGMSLSKDGSKLLLNTVKGSKLMLTVIDIATMTRMQKIELGTEPEEGYCEVEYYDDFIAVMEYHYFENNNTIGVFSQVEDGTYQLAFRVPVDSEGFSVTDEKAIFPDRPYDMDFDGEKLVLAHNKYNLLDGRYIRGDTCDFYLVIYNKTGMVYAGEFQVSLTQVNNTEASRPVCRPFGNEPLTVSWE